MLGILATISLTTGLGTAAVTVSKKLTATAATKLAEKGRLDLEKPIGHYLSDVPDSWQPITTRQLLSHASGIAHYSSPEDALDVRQYANTSEALARFKNRPLRHRPGEGETYSSYAYTVIAAVIEAITGQSFLDAIREEVFEPLGMRNTVPDMQSALVPNRTAFY